MKRRYQILRIIIALLLSPVSVAGYVSAWLYVAVWTGFYWGMENSTELMPGKSGDK